MSSAGISFGGLGSGLDTQSIISALMAIERRPIAALEQKKSSFSQQKSLFGDLGSLLDKLQDAAQKLRTTTDFLSMSATSSHTDILTASASSNATPGSYQVTVNSLATAQANGAGSSDPDTTPHGDGTIWITTGGVVHSIDVGSGSGYASTLDGIRNAINDQNIDVSASVVDTGVEGSDRYQLVLRSNTAGSAGAFTVEMDSGTAPLQTLVDDLNANQLTAASNASLEINGLTVERSSNSITDVIPGITLNLESAPTPPTAVTITVTTDAEETASTVQEFVDAYNEVVDFVSGQNALGEDGEARNPLFGDTTLRSIRTSLRSIVGGSVDTGNPAAALLVQIGISSDRDGKLTFNQSEFEQSLVEDEQAVASLFAQASTGIAQRIFDQIDVYTDSVDGLIKARTDGFDRLIRDTTGRIERAEDRLDRTEASLQQRFANLESLIARLQGQGSALAAFPTMGQSS